MVVLGGAPRCGKGIMSNLLMRQIGIPYLSIDPVKMALAGAIPDYPLDTNAASIEVAEAMWPLLSAFIANCIETRVPYIVEGEILPTHINQLSQSRSIIVLSCFVGYKDIAVRQKVRQIKDNAGYANDWSSSVSDGEMYKLVESGIEYSRFLYRECKTFGLRYIDFSNNFEASKDEVVRYLSSSYLQKVSESESS